MRNWGKYATTTVIVLLLSSSVLQVGCNRQPEDEKPKAVGTSGRSTQQFREGGANAALQSALEARTLPRYVATDDEGRQIWKSVRRFYKLNGPNLAWTYKGRPKSQARELLDTVENASREGLSPADYDLQSFVEVRNASTGGWFSRRSIDEQQLPDIDLRLTYLYVKYATHLVAGRVDPEGVDPHWFVASRRVDVANLLKRSLDSGAIGKSLEQLSPQHPEYTALRDALARYREVAKGGWPAVPPEAAGLKKGARSAAVAHLQRRLAASGDMPEDAVAPATAPAATSGKPSTTKDASAQKANGSAQTRNGQPAPPPEPVAVFDDATVEGVKRFQARHGITQDGIVGKATLAAMNVPIERRIEQLELNLERWRWLPERLGTRHIIVNVPAFALDAYEDGNASLSMKVVVGKEDSPTPIFADQMTTVVFSPHWNVPESIALNETLPEVLKDPAYLERNNIEVVSKDGKVVDPGSIDWTTAGDNFPYRFRQRPGTENSLGLVKFLFPNQFNVYLHDTPADSLFNRLERDFSHGCVRVEKPVELAQWVLRSNPEWTRERIDEAMHAGREQSVALKDPIPVYLIYQTAWVSRDGITHFYDDLYGHDATQLRILGESGAPGETN